MENIILSLLLLKSMTIYEMKSYIQQELSTVCSASLGSLQTAIKKLLEKGFIKVSKFIENSTLKKEYHITNSGVKYYKSCSGTPINIQKIKNMEWGKVFFLGMAEKEKRISFLESYIGNLKKEYAQLLQIKKMIDKNKDSAVEKNVRRIEKDHSLKENLLTVSSEESLWSVVNNINNYQIYMLEYGLERIKSDLSFYKKILKREMES